ncbi:gliding motility protein GldN [Bacteroidales bacterium AH-315-I05]|nr:gliding motility protein GldN [Bacteroidales bacterium AH-315-I05]
MKRLVIVAIALLTIASGNLAAQESTVLDGVYIREHTLNRKVVPYPSLREADVMWLKRVWREIDMRQKINHPMYYPAKPVQGRKNLFDVIKDAITRDNTLTAYSVGALNDDDMFTQELTLPEVLSKLSDTVVVYTEDPDTGEPIETFTVEDVTGENVKMYRLKEEWFFDNQRSVLDVRIIGICPFIEEFNEYGEFKGYKPLFWIYFPEAREVFKMADVFNRSNDSERRTYEDIFWKRQFGSYIIKESNVYDRFINEYKVGLDALLESEKIKDNIFNMEHDLWHF